MNRPQTNSIIVAADGMTYDEALNLSNALAGQPGYWGLKLNDGLDGLTFDQLELFSHDGGIFGDLKLHDIPQTVSNRVKKYVPYCDFITLHIVGGKQMIRAALDEVRDSRATMVGVTILTSLEEEDLNQIGMYPGTLPTRERVQKIATYGRNAGLDTFVCSGKEVELVRSVLRDGSGGADIPYGTIITPGVRLAGSGTDDQKRVVTPGQAIASGADFVVVGRDITRAKDPVEALARIQSDIKEHAS